VNSLKTWTIGAKRSRSCSSAIDPRQRDQTHTGEIAINDVWRLGTDSDLQLAFPLIGANVWNLLYNEQDHPPSSAA